MSIPEAVALATAIYALAVTATYLLLLSRTPGCGRNLLRCVRGRELVVIVAIILAQMAIMMLVATIALSP
ncbi:hypothetical protein [Thermoproteus uzoniensis]|nr:hypothetical protein [Thermoproteus uzoniensis]